jgi:excisionase family DNA binding protein
MSSNIKVQRICQHCGAEFTARTTVTRYCSDKCSKAAYKARIRAEKVQKSNVETLQVKTKPIEELKAKEFLTVQEVARLLNCSVRSTYYYIKTGKIRAVNLGQRLTRVKRSEIDKLFEQPEQPKPETKQFDISDCYTISEVIEKYSISRTALQNLIKRENIPKINKGWSVFVPKPIIEKLLT